MVCAFGKNKIYCNRPIKKGKVKVNGEGIKPAREVKIGDTIQIIKHNAVFSFKIKDLLKNRVGAKLVENYIVDTTLPEEIEKYKLYQASQRVYRDYGTGKPSKKDRRDLEDYLDWD
jgi:Ribosome-associated heat shock protein implicated in the recycling of the 50S subunit (S4 paralog)